MRLQALFVLSLLLFSTALRVVAEPLDLDSLFETRTYAGADGGKLPYRIHLPKNLAESETAPLVLFLHGAGERGDDNRAQLKHVIPEIMAYLMAQEKEAIVIAPQCPAQPAESPNGEAETPQWVMVPWGDAEPHTMPDKPSGPMRLVMELLDQVMEGMPVDTKRVYVCGLSMGGFGVWDIIQRRPEWFAAAVPVCGGADDRLAPKLAGLPIWVHHGENDEVVKTARSRSMVAALEEAGGSPKYTEYPGVGHNSWGPAFRDSEVLEWMFSQSRE